MIIQNFLPDGSCVIEKARVNTRFLELPDGYHPLTNDSVWQDDKRRQQPILVVFDGCLGPLGADMTEEDIKTLLTEIEMIKLAFKKPTISRMWMRWLSKMFSAMLKYGVTTIVFIMMAYYIGIAMYQGVG